MRKDAKIGLFIGLGVLGGLALALTEPPEPGRPSPPKPSSPPGAPPVGGPIPPDAEDDETALARMLQSETSDEGARVVIGWLAIRTAQRRNQSLFVRLTAGAGYGPRIKDGVSRYASTAKPPTAASRALAKKLLSGEVEPAFDIRSRQISAWVEEEWDDKKQFTEKTASALLKKQRKPREFGGIWGRIEGTRWYLFSDKTPPITNKPTARAALDAVPVFSAIDS